MLYLLIDLEILLFFSQLIFYHNNQYAFLLFDDMYY